MDDSGLAQVERKRIELEENIGKLRKSLQHWQTWEIEYEGLREEIASLPTGSNRNDVLAIAREFRAKLVDDKELQTIVGREGEPIRTQGQIVDLLAKRVDYVSRNTRTIEKQLSDAQKKRNALLLAKEPEYRDDAGLPLTDITEELDDNGNVVSSRVETPASTAPLLVEVLSKAGVKDLVEQDGIITASTEPSGPVKDHQRQSSNGEEGTVDALSKVRMEKGGKYIAHNQLPEGETENVSRSDGGLGDAAANKAEGHFKSPNLSSGIAGLAVTGNLSNGVAAGVVSGSQKPEGDSTVGINGGDMGATSLPGDSPEEAELRHEMLQYGLGEMGAIVAELDLEENQSDASYTDDQAALSFGSDSDEDELNDEDQSEDETGMVKHPVMSRKYLQKMKELEEKYGIKGLQNLGPDASKLPEEVHNELDKPPAAEAARKSALAREAEVKDAATVPPRLTMQRPAKPRKKVAFAEDLDIAPEKEPAMPNDVPKSLPERLNLVEPIKDSIVERQSAVVSADSPQLTGQGTPKKSSRFRAAREATPQTPLLPPSPTSQFPSMLPHKIHADSIIERDISTTPNPPDPHDLDEEMHRKEIAGEYYKLRNRMIQRQGGFVGGGEADNYGEEITPLPIVDENGKVRKISRFKAARLK